MSTFGRVMAISIGVLGGGGLGFYYRETYWTQKKLAECEELERELIMLRETRRMKEQQLAAARNK